MEEHIAYKNESSLLFVNAPKDKRVISEIRNHKLELIKNTDGRNKYKEFLKESFNPLRLYNEKFLPKQTSKCYKITYANSIVAIFRLSPVANHSVFHKNIENAMNCKILEVNNVAVSANYRGRLLLGIILNQCVLLSRRLGFDIVAGIVRYEVLKLFTDYGTIPVAHPPLHLLGDETINDFITYFRTDSKAAVDYAVSRSYHFFHRKVIMNEIRSLIK